MITLQQIQDAHKKILPYVNYTPLINSNFLSKNTTVKLKLENFQITGSFKLRGAVNKLLSLSEDDKTKESSQFLQAIMAKALLMLQRYWDSINNIYVFNGSRI